MVCYFYTPSNIILQNFNLLYLFGYVFNNFLNFKRIKKISGQKNPGPAPGMGNYFRFMTLRMNCSPFMKPSEPFGASASEYA